MEMYIDPHIHLVSRTTDDYEAMRKAGIVATIEPAFWLGQPRTEVGSFKDYFSTLVGWERFRASQFGIVHYCTMGLNSKEANNVALAEQVMELLPLYAGKEGVVAIGEIGYDDQTEAEDRFYRLWSITTMRKQSKKFWIAAFGLHLPFIHIPKWALSGWWRSSSNMAPSASL